MRRSHRPGEHENSRAPMVLPTPKQVKLKKPSVRGNASAASGLSDSAINDSTDLQANSPDKLPATVRGYHTDIDLTRLTSCTQLPPVSRMLRAATIRPA
jgi:hypothetical protein